MFQSSGITEEIHSEKIDFIASTGLVLARVWMIH
jgi:hypothetical protein